MLAIRMQRTGRKGHAQFRLIVQDSHFSPTSGRVVAYLGSYNPHTKATILDAEKAAKYLQNGAQPSDRVARLMKKEGVKLPSWVKLSDQKKRTIRHPEKLRRNRPAGEPAPKATAESEVTEEIKVEEAPAEPTETAPETETTEETAEESQPSEETPKAATDSDSDKAA